MVIDFYYNYSEKEVQKKSFIEHINAAAELNIPIIVLLNFCSKGEFCDVKVITVVCLVFPFDSGNLITNGETVVSKMYRCIVSILILQKP